MSIRSFLASAFLGLVAITGCKGDDPVGPAGPGGAGGAGATGGEGGELGGEGGIGGSAEGGGGGMGGSGGQPDPWPSQCLTGCSRLETCMGGNVCATVLNTSCGGTPPAQPYQCLIECVADTVEPSDCSAVSGWLNPASKPTAPSDFARCLAQCPGPPAETTAPAWGIVECASDPAFCATAMSDCIGDTTCKDWYVNCASECTDPTTAAGYPSSSECWKQCTLAQGAGNAQVDALTQCLCDVQTNEANQGPPAKDWFGTADCSDIIYGHMNACALTVLGP